MSRRISPASLATTAVTALLLTSLGGPAEAGSAASAGAPSKATWERDVTRAYQDDRTVGATTYINFQAYLDARVARGGKLAMNLDIDNTSIATYYAYPKAVPDTLKVVSRFRSKGVTIFFNTGRYADQLGGIKKALTNAGYRYAEVCGRKHGEGLTASKQRCRKHFVALGYTLIANVGNSETDLSGGDYEANGRLRLPNYGGALS